MKTAFTLCFAWLLVLSSTSHGAIVVNGGFEDAPDFNGWTTAGLTSVQGNYLTISPTGGSKQAVLLTGDGAVGNTGASLAELATTLSVTLADITAVAPNAFNGSAISQNFTSVSAGDTLTFDWSFITSETNATAQDTAFFSVSRDGGTPQTIFLANPSDADQNFNQSPFSRRTDYFTSYPSVPYKFLEGGDYVVGFGVVNLDDATFPSGLLIDNVTLTAVPEPTALTGLGLLGLTLAMRRRRRR